MLPAVDEYPAPVATLVPLAEVTRDDDVLPPADDVAVLSVSGLFSPDADGGR